MATEPEPPHETEPKFLPPPEACRVPDWGELVRRYGPRLRTRLRSALRRAGWTPRPDGLEDLAQEVFCRLLASGGRRLAAFRGDSAAQLDSYLGRVAERVAIDAVRAARARKRDGLRCGRHVDPAFLQGVADPAGTPLDRLMVRERGRQFVARCCRLVGPGAPARDLRILQMALVEGWTSREISRSLGGRLAASSIDSLVHRVRRKLAAEGIELPARPRPPRSGQVAGRRLRRVGGGRYPAGVRRGVRRPGGRRRGRVRVAGLR